MQDDRSRRGKFLGFVAHEIKNPLSTALWSADLLRRLDAEERAGPRADRMIDASLRALRRMRRLVDDFFTIERLAQRVLEMRREAHALRSLLDAAVALLGDKEKAEAAAWLFDVPADLHARCDGELIKRSLRALLERVSRAGDGPLTVVGRQANGHATVWIGHREPGAQRALVPPLPEEQAGGDADGSVLGYELARTVAEAHGGALEERDGGLWLALPYAG
jgi:signal transduction histidine kinase